MSGLSEQERDDMAAALMRRWGCADDDQDAYDGACADVDTLAPLFAARTEQARPEHVVKAEALREAADWLEGRLGVRGTPKSLYEFRQWLRDRADALEAMP